jgi:hypothetical protein
VRSPVAYIIVACDKCKSEESIELTTTARGYDERNVDAELESMGWEVGIGDICPSCVEDMKEGDEHER